ncbi:hypothetical protein [Candidatus Thiosymbion oneisti]|uniref:hypothetical protein n=1 Tax=Candidatus Thiosymbion oneisti TaxID=589554 RepID=UPI000A728187|nr:hypothetical protein [Candidatus Thiosymbion oneisti]
MYKTKPTIVLGFHACTESTARKLISDSGGFTPSGNSYDWLGHGMYFWENSWYRAVQFAHDRAITSPAVVGAVLHLGYCLDFTDSESLSYLSSSYSALKDTLEIFGKPLPINKPGSGLSSDDLLLRDLDCAVINFLHSQRERENRKRFDSVRGVFWEGNDIYPGAGFKEKNHIQICIRNPNCIKGFFHPREVDTAYDVV